jgi:hypothetical protein
VRSYPRLPSSTFSIQPVAELDSVGIDVAVDDVLFDMVTKDTQLMRDNSPWRGGREKDPLLLQLFIEFTTQVGDIVLDCTASTGTLYLHKLCRGLVIASSYSFAHYFLDFLQELLSTLVARLVAILWPWRGIRTSSKPFWNPSFWTLSLKASRSSDLRLLVSLMILKMRSSQTQTSSPSTDTVSKFYPPFILFFASVNNQPHLCLY